MENWGWNGSGLGGPDDNNRAAPSSSTHCVGKVRGWIDLADCMLPAVGGRIHVHVYYRACLLFFGEREKGA